MGETHCNLSSRHHKGKTIAFVLPFTVVAYKSPFNWNHYAHYVGNYGHQQKYNFDYDDFYYR